MAKRAAARICQGADGDCAALANYAISANRPGTGFTDPDKQRDLCKSHVDDFVWLWARECEAGVHILYIGG